MWTKVTRTFTIEDNTITGNKVMEVLVGAQPVLGVSYDPAEQLEVRNVKLEESPVATFFETPDMAEELIKCQRYYQRLSHRVYLVPTNNTHTTKALTVSFQEMGFAPSFSRAIVGDGAISIESTTKSQWLLVKSGCTAGNVHYTDSLILTAEI